MHINAYMIREVEIFKAIGEQTRLRIMRLLVKAKIELCACEIIDVLEKPQYTVSKNLGILVNAGLLKERREGRMMFYKIDSGDEFNKNIFKSVELIKCDSNPVYKNDFLRLSKRISFRKNGDCITGCVKL